MIRAVLIFLPLSAVIAADDPAQHADRAAAYVQRGDLKSAETELRKAVELSPADPALLTSLGGVLGMEGDLRQANVYLGRAVKLNPRDPLLLRNLAANEWQLGRFQQARQHVETLLRANARDQGAIFLLGMVSENEKDYARSIKLLESIPEVVERQPEALVALASSYYHTGRRDDAESALDKFRARSEKPQVVFMAGRVAMDAHDYARAEQLFSKVRTTYADPGAVEAQIAMAQYRQGRAADSEKTLLEAMRAGHTNVESQLLLCKVLADRADYTRALQVAAGVAQAHPDSYEALSTRGAMELKLQYFSAAVSTLTKAAEMHPSAETKRELALATWRAGNRQQAISEFEAAIRQFPRDARTYEEYGTLLIEDASPESKHRAADLFKHAVALDGSAVEARFQLANMALADGQLQAALVYLEKAIQSAPDDSRLHFALSRVYRRLGRDSEAGRELAAYQRLKKPVE
jgi:protein O-GlcNAc transferase